jgi:cytochrome c oxidase subunit IV
MEETNKMEETTKKDEQTSTQKIGIYLWIWLLLFVLSFFRTWLTGTNFKEC